MKNNALHISLICVIGIAIGAFIMFQMNISIKKIHIDTIKFTKDISKINEDLNGLTLSISHLHKMINNVNSSQAENNDAVCCFLNNAAKEDKDLDADQNLTTNIQNTEEFDLVDLDDIIEEVEQKQLKEDNNKNNGESVSFDTMTYEDARDMCKQKGLSSKGKKEQLIERLKSSQS